MESTLDDGENGTIEVRQVWTYDEDNPCLMTGSESFAPGDAEEPSSSLELTWEEDTLVRAVANTTPASTTEFTYEDGRLTRYDADTTIGDTAFVATSIIGYGDDGQVSSHAYTRDDGQFPTTTYYERDEDGRLLKVVWDSGSDGEITSESTWERDDEGRELSRVEEGTLGTTTTTWTWTCDDA